MNRMFIFVQIEFHAEFKNELFVHGHHIQQFITLKVFAIQAICSYIMVHYLSFGRCILNLKVNWQAYQRKFLLF